MDRCRRSVDVAAGATIARFFGDSFERRTNQRLRAVAGDPQLASLISLDSGRPHLLLDATPERTPWLNAAKFAETGGVVVWRASDTAGTPPADIAKRFPGLVSGSAARVRMVRQRPPAAAADRLGHRAAEGAVSAPHGVRRRHRVSANARPMTGSACLRTRDGTDAVHRLQERRLRALLRMRGWIAPAPSRWRADPATTSACRTASAADRPDGTSRWRGSCACRCRSRTICRACA